MGNFNFLKVCRGTLPIGGGHGSPGPNGSYSPAFNSDLEALKTDIAVLISIIIYYDLSLLHLRAYLKILFILLHKCYSMW